MKKRTQGFTLIELLVVIAIVALLSSAVLYYVGSARSKGRDGTRFADLKEFQKQIALYFDDCNGYPGTAGGLVTIGGTDFNSASSFTGCTKTLGGYISRFPTDPKNTGNYVYKYCSSSNGTTCNTLDALSTDYIVTFYIENASGSLAAGAHLMTAAGMW